MPSSSSRARACRTSSNVRWGLSERPFLLIIPAKGELAYVAPGFEEMRAREITTFTERRPRVAGRRGLGRGRGRHPQGSRRRDGHSRRRGTRALLHRGRAFGPPRRRFDFVLATPVTAGCRMIKSPAEIALMQRANDITIEAYQRRLRHAADGMTQFDFQRNVRAAFEALGAPGGSASVQFGEYTAFPHGSIQPQTPEGRRRRPRRRRLQRRRLSVGHHPHDGLRQADRSARSTCGISRRRRRPRRSRPRRSAPPANPWTPPRAK